MEKATFEANQFVGKEVDMKSYINDLVDKLRQDLEVYEIIKKFNLTLGEVKENIAKFTDFREDYNYCKACPGVDKCNKKTPHLKMNISKDYNLIRTDYEPCSKIMEQIRLDSKYLYKDFPLEWKSSTLKTLDLSENRRPVIKEFAKIMKGTSSRWIFVTGNHKVGKSFLLVTFANEFVACGKGQVAIINASDKIKKLADLAYKDADSFSREIVNLSNVPLLILDDFGEEYKNEFIRDQIIIPILSERSRKMKPTFFTSCFSMAEIKELYSMGKNGGSIRGKQLYGLLLDMCEEEFDLTGASIYKNRI